nr:MAG TPA: hypothetical protein [Caudoviricetes sp.]
MVRFPDRCGPWGLHRNGPADAGGPPVTTLRPAGRGGSSRRFFKN